MYFQHFGQSPLPAYEPAFDWENEHSMIFGQRIPAAHIMRYVIFAVWSISESFQLKTDDIAFLPYLPLILPICYLCGVSGLKISVKVLSLSFQAGLVGKCSCLNRFCYLFCTCLACFSLSRVSLNVCFPCRAILWYNLLI